MTAAAFAIGCAVFLFLHDWAFFVYLCVLVLVSGAVIGGAFIGLTYLFSPH